MEASKMIQNIDNSQIGYTAHTSYQRSITAAQVSIGSVSGTNGDKSYAADQVSFNFFRLEESGTYTNTGSIETMADKAYDILRSHVLDIFEKQGMNTALSVNGETIDLESLSAEKAQELVSEDGYFGIEQTSDRIVDFAIGIAGGDASRIDAILEGVEKGFQEALDAFGGWLPEISHETYDKILEKLDTWVNNTQ